MSEADWPNAPMSRFLEAGGLCWHVQQAGQGPPLLLIHGTGASTHSWRELMPLLAPNYSVLAMDLPGHGRTAAAGPARSSIAGMSAALGELLRALAFEPSYAVGHSAGAALLCRLALDKRIAPRVIVALNGAFLPLAGAAGILFAPIAKLFASSSLLPRLIARRAGNVASVARIIAGTGSTLDAAGLTLYARLLANPAHVAGALGMMAHWDLYAFERELPALSTPLALIVGERDRTVPPAQAHIVAQRLARACIHTLPGLGHLAHEEEPRRVAQLIEEICRAH